MPEDNNNPAADEDVSNIDTGENGDGGEPNATPNDGNDQPKNGEPKKANDPDDNEPPVKQRKNVKDFIIARKQAKIEKLKTQKGESNDDQGDDNADDNDDDVLPEDREAILKTVAPVLKPFIEKSLQAEDEAELQQFVKDNPEFAPYAAKARSFMQHPSRRNIPIETIFMEAAGGINGIMKLGAQRLKNANDKARNGQTGGGSTGGDGGFKSWKDAPFADLEAEKERIRRESRR